MIAQDNDLPTADAGEHETHAGERDGLIQATNGRVREVRRICRVPIEDAPLDVDAIRAEARRAHADGDCEGARRRLAEHHRFLSEDANDGLTMRCSAVVSSLERNIGELERAEQAAEKERKRVGEHRAVRTQEGTTWTALSIVSIAIFAAITVFLFYSSMKVVIAFLDDLGRIDEGADGFVIAPLTVLAPFVIYIISLFIPDRNVRKRYAIGVAITGILCFAVWVLAFPFADPHAGGESDDPWGGGAGTPGPLSAWYVATVAQLFFDVLTAAACKISIHLICDSHAGVSYRTNRMWTVHTRRLNSFVRTRRPAEDALGRLKGRLNQFNARTATFCKRATDAFDDRLKQLHTHTLDVREIRDPGERGGVATQNSGETAAEMTNLNGRLS